MDWYEIRKRLRRFLRDPDGNIWDDALLKNLYNDEQSYICQATQAMEKVQVLRVPPFYQTTHTHDWEYAFADHDGKNRQCLEYHHQSDLQLCYRWEGQLLGYGSSYESDDGDHYTQPWEAWATLTAAPGEPAPVWFPQDFRTAKFVAWDKDPISYASAKEISSQDPSWRIRTGLPLHYSRRDEYSNEFFLYPHPSTQGWDDVDPDTMDADTIDGQVIFDDSRTESSEYGAIMDATGQVMNMDEGIVTEALGVDNNVLLVYAAESTDIEMEDDEGSLPAFLQKYCEQATLERAYAANTDGRIPSLRDYWGWRAKLGLEVIKKYRTRRYTDREFRLVTQDRSVERRRVRHPRLPDEYPAI